MEDKLKDKIDSFIATSEKFLNLIENYGKDLANHYANNEMGNIVTIQNLIDGISELEGCYDEPLQSLYNRAQVIYASSLG